jgi:ATP-dependent helicase/nuclease subunit A
MADKESGFIPPHLAAVPADVKARRQYSFSRLSGRLQRQAETLPADRDEWEAASPATIDPRGLGTLVHAVLADPDLALGVDVADLVHRHALRHFSAGDCPDFRASDRRGDGSTGDCPDSREAKMGLFPSSRESSRDVLAAALTDAETMLRVFLTSPRFGAMTAAKELYREIEFLLAWPPEGSDPSPVFLQGFIDNLYRDESGAWHLVDYKTNQVTPRTLAKVAADYEMQMLLYALAAETTLGVAPVELVLHFLRGGLEYCFPWDSAAKARIRQLIDAAI